MSTIKVNKIEHTSTTDGGVSIDSSGNVTLPANTKVGTQNLPSAGPLSNRNLVINGAMRVAQRGTSSTVSTYGAVDRFRPSFNNVGVTQSQETLSSGDPYNEGFRYFNRYSNTSVSSAASTYIEIFTKIEAQDIAGSGWDYSSTSSYITISFWVRSSLAGTYYSVLRSLDGTNKYYSKAFTLSANTWSKVTYSAPGHSDLAFANDNGEGLRVHVIPYYGTDYTDNSVSTDTWFTLSGGNHMPDYLQNWANTASATFDITGVQLEVGAVATPFEHRSYGDELARCQRYYQQIDGTSAYTLYGAGRAGSATNFRVPVFLRTTMRAVPTIGSSGNFTATGGGDVTTISITHSTTDVVQLSCAASGMTTGQCISLNADNDTTTQINFSAEL